MTRNSQNESLLESNKSSWVKDLKSFVFLIFTVFILFKGIFITARVPTSSMVPTIKEHSVLIGWRLSYLLSDPIPERGDIIVFDHEEFDEHLVKRVIGLPGDEVSVADGQVFINGEKLDEPYLAESDMGRHDGQFTVPEGKLLVLGDNRNHSNDSRCWDNPYVDVHNIFAKVLLILNNPFQ